MDTFAEIPWQPGHGDARRRPARQPRHGARHLRRLHAQRRALCRATRAVVLKRQLERAKKLGYIWNAGPELEFFLFRSDEDGEHQAAAPRRRRLLRLLDRPGGAKSARTWSTRSRRSASASRPPTTRWRAGQHEIDFQYADGLRTADNAVTFKFTLKAIAQLHGLYATFMPKPIFGINGSGMHTHQSLWHIGKEANALRRSRFEVRPVADLARSRTWPASWPTPAA